MGTKLPNGKNLPAIDSMESLGAAIQQIRKEQGLTQLDIAGLAGFGNRFIVELEKGKPTVQMGKVLEILHLLGLELSLKRKGK